jgi:hypothetical protein
MIASLRRSAMMKTFDHAARSHMYEVLERDLVGVALYRAAIDAVPREDLCEEWREELGAIEDHASILRLLLERLGLDPDANTPARERVRQEAWTRLRAIRLARRADNAEARERLVLDCLPRRGRGGRDARI